MESDQSRKGLGARRRGDAGGDGGPKARASGSLMRVDTLAHTWLQHNQRVGFTGHPPPNAGKSTLGPAGALNSSIS
eukprot:83062-Alexandrium_andersonii.AAC.1